MNGAELGLAVSVFLASAVECVEALTIVLAVGSTRSWRSALAGVGAALVALAVVIAALGAGLSALPVDALRLIIGALLLLFGAQWLRKAVLRQAGRKALRDEDAAFREELDAAHTAERPAGEWDPYAFSIAAKGVLLEGLEVALIVVTFGADHHRTGLAAAAAGVAVLTVLLAGVAVRRPLARVPENLMKYAVGVLLSAFGIFWFAEGAGVSWPGGEAILLALIAAVLACSLLAVQLLRRTPGDLA
ncbi:MAG: hypothetical protein QOK19_2215 [Solirubrobacteraceae bacterium]|jgi:uncharacterized membrane protein|nr:hypothetical protein [Solirubrobacterales bacterium]MEA2216654.1 hypothetical protein [Solirubrobacteraceae bacterium]